MNRMRCHIDQKPCEDVAVFGCPCANCQAWMQAHAELRRTVVQRTMREDGEGTCTLREPEELTQMLPEDEPPDWADSSAGGKRRRR